MIFRHKHTGNDTHRLFSADAYSSEALTGIQSVHSSMVACVCNERECVCVCVCVCVSKCSYRRLRVDPVLPFTGRLPLSLSLTLRFSCFLSCYHSLSPSLLFILSLSLSLSLSPLSGCQSWAALPCVSPRTTATQCAYTHTHIDQLLFPWDKHADTQFAKLLLSKISKK